MIKFWVGRAIEFSRDNKETNADEIAAVVIVTLSSIFPISH